MQDNIVVDTLKDSIQTILRFELIKNEDREILKHLLETLKYYSMDTAYDEFYTIHSEKIQMVLKQPYKNSIDVHCIEEHEDGSATIEITYDKTYERVFIEEGISFLLLKGALNGSTNDISIWAERGKEETKIDNILSTITP